MAGNLLALSLPRVLLFKKQTSILSFFFSGPVKLLCHWVLYNHISSNCHHFPSFYRTLIWHSPRHSNFFVCLFSWCFPYQSKREVHTYSLTVLGQMPLCISYFMCWNNSKGAWFKYLAGETDEKVVLHYFIMLATKPLT